MQRDGVGGRRCRAAAFASIFACAVIARSARAEEPVAVVLGLAAESATQTLAPTALLRVPVGDVTVLEASQIGWTSQVGFEHALTTRVALALWSAVTPWHAHLSNVAFDRGRRTQAGEFDAAAWQGGAGLRFDDQQHVRAALGVTALREWIGDIDAAIERRWEAIYVGADLQLEAAWLRSQEPVRGRADGCVLTAAILAFAGREPWFNLRVGALAGRRIGRFFLGASLAAFHVASDDVINRVPVGGSWDALGSDALYGFPLAAYRLASAANAGLRADLRLLGTLELGLRSSVLLHQRGFAYGAATQLMLGIAGIDCIAGIGLARPDAFALNAYASVRSLWLF